MKFKSTLITALIAVLATSASAATLIDGSGIIVTAVNYNGSFSADAQGVVDGTGLTAGVHGTGGSSEWYTILGNDPAETWISFDLGSTAVLDSIHVWNATQFDGFGIAQLDIYVSSLAAPGDPEGAGAGDWTKIADNVSFAAAGSPNVGFDLETQTGISLPTTAVRHMRFEVDTRIDAGSTYVGLAEVQFFQVPEPSTALLGGLGVLALLRRRRN